MARLSPEQRKRWNGLIRWLKEGFPAAYPVRVRTCRISKLDAGHTYFSRRPIKEFVIHISEGSDFRDRVESLLHEWAHATSWSFKHDSPQCEDFHDAAWGVEYAKIYSGYERNFIED